MASEQNIVDFIIDQIQEAGNVSARKMFGEYGIYCDGKMVALVCDDILFVKPTEAGKALLDEVVEGSPYPNAKPHFQISPEKWDNREWLTQLIKVSAEHLPLPKKKPAKKKT